MPRSTVAVVVALAAAGAALALLFGPFVDAVPPGRPWPAPSAEIAFLPPAAEEAPAPLRRPVVEGRAALRDPAAVLPVRVAGRLRCTSCHFSDGRTRGGENGGVSLVGAAAARDLVPLHARVNRCVVENVRGEPLAADAPALAAILAYVGWISSGIPVDARVPWRGLGAVDGPLDPARGAATVAARCAPCHGADGQGTEIAPPLWGPRSFSRASAMADPHRLAAFVHANMPREYPFLSREEALAAAAFVARQPRER